MDALITAAFFILTYAVSDWLVLVNVKTFYKEGRNETNKHYLLIRSPRVILYLLSFVFAVSFSRSNDQEGDAYMLIVSCLFFVSGGVLALVDAFKAVNRAD